MMANIRASLALRG